MTVKTIDIVRVIITLNLLVFHCSMTWFIFYMMKIRKNKLYISQFYVLYLIISIADIAQIINNILVVKVILVEAWKPWFIANPNWSTVFWLISGILIYYQSLLHAAIAINRAWISAFTNQTKYKQITQIGKYLIWLLPFLALAIAAPRFLGHSVYYVSQDGEIAAVYVETFVQVYHSIAGPSVVISTSAISFIMAIVTIQRYRYLFKKFKNNFGSTMKHDVLLFSQAFIVLLFQMALAGYYVIVIIARVHNLPDLQAFAFTFFGFITDALSLINPIALIIVCNFIRKDYFEFIFCGRKLATSLIWTSSP